MNCERQVIVTATQRDVRATCNGGELKAAGMPEDMREFAAALELFANWAYHRGLAQAAANYEAKEATRKRQDDQLLASIRVLVGKSKGV